MIVDPADALESERAMNLLAHENAYLRARLAERQREEVGWLALDVTGERYQRQQVEIARLRRELKALRARSTMAGHGQAPLAADTNDEIDGDSASRIDYGL